MPQTCKTCRHEKRAEIEAALIAREPLRSIAQRYGIHNTSILRHFYECVPEAMAKAQDAHEVATGDRLLNEVTGLKDRAEALLTQAEQDGDLRAGAALIREARSCVELLARLMGQLEQKVQVNVLVAPELKAVQQVIVQSLAEYPEARGKVIEGIATLEARQ